MYRQLKTNIDGMDIRYSYCSLGIYIESMFLEEQERNKGIGTKALKEFISRNTEYNIYLFASGEHGVNTKILEKWYSKIGFVRKNINILGIPFKCNYVLYNDICNTKIKGGNENGL